MLYSELNNKVKGLSLKQYEKKGKCITLVWLISTLTIHNKV